MHTSDPCMSDDLPPEGKPDGPLGVGKITVPNGARLTIVKTISYQTPTDQPTTIAAQWAKTLTQSNQPYKRVIEVGESWRKLPYQFEDEKWETELIAISNETGRDYLVNPTDEQVKADERKVIEVGLNIMEFGPGQVYSILLIPPGEFREETFTYPDRLMIRSRNGQVKCIVWAFPK